ncbi:MAG: amidohydrolase family protein [Armatimonadetes bacterium]|nr:amidohydrolase family protein [Candidatus Hippobium faecium]
MNIIDVNTLYGAGTSSVFRNSADVLEEYLTNNGIGKALTLNVSGVKNNYSYGNRKTITELADSSVLVPVATVNPKGFFGNVKELTNIKEQGFKAIKFFPNMQDWKLDNIVFKEILQFNNNVGLPIIVNTKFFGEITELSYAYEYDYPLICSRVSYENCAEFVSFAKKHRNVFVECSYFNSHSVLYKIIENLGCDRVLFGSMSMKNLASVAVDYISKADISDEDKEKIFSGNALRIFGGSL